MGRKRTLQIHVGDVFGRLTVEEVDVPGHERRMVRVRCSCSERTEKVLQLTSVASGAVKSCGCLNREVAAERARSRTLPPELRKPKYTKVTPRYRIDDEGRECSKCRTYKLWDEFNRGNGARGYSSWCRACSKKQHHDKPYELRRTYSLKSRLAKYSLTVEQYEHLLSKYGGRCWRCKRFETAKGPGGKVQRLSVDHDHGCCPGDSSCGRCIRGLLCVGCNFILGRIDGGQVDSYLVYLARGYVDLAAEMPQSD